MDKQEDYKNIINDTLSQVKDEFKKLKKINIVIAGKTGVGKSTLINAAFGQELA
ncbi:GTPase [Lacticaseibacillus hegangensis]|uniref:GTPase n=1 Tax=Lacticaseibacillus hegangensis TaxID=2486010 RepID=A0ABW4CVZ3_9LACO|nr:GTPase [Lacticaseibacillus hegangensis]